MARVKKPDTPPPPPKHPRECKHGCGDCVHFRLDVKAFPCRDCERWNYWEDAHPEKNNAVPFPPPASAPTTPAQDPTTSAEEPKKSSRRTQISSTPPVMAEQAPVVSKKRGRKPKSDAIVAEGREGESAQPSAAPAKRVRKSPQKADDASELPSPEKDQLSFF